MIRLSLAAALFVATPSAAQQAKSPTPYDRAIAAGYKAAMLCSGVFNAGRTEAQIDADELTGIYPEYDAIVPTLTAAVDRRQAIVTVAWSDTLPPRRSEWHKTTGCTTMPIGAAPAPVASSYATPPGPAPADPRAWPRGDGGIAPRPLPMLAKAFDRTTYGEGANTVGTVVVRDGRVVAERYRDGFGPFVSNRTWSVGKSLAGTVIGAATLAGKIDVSKPARIPEWGPWPWQDRRAAITTDQLLRMASGLHSDTAGNRTDAIYFGGAAVREDATHWPLEALPGTRFRYANNDILLAMRGLHASMADDRAFAAFVPELFVRLGMAHTVAETDWRGDYVISSQVWTTARDLARAGMLYLNDGVWNGERILPAGWVKYVSTPSGPQPEGDFGYGATFWLMNKSPGVPTDTFAAFGNRGQYVVIVPSRKTVIVRRGEDPGSARFDIAKFTADVLAALR